MKLYSNEIVFRGHPDKVADQIGDALLDVYISNDPNSRCGIEVTGGKGKIFVTGEVTSRFRFDIKVVIDKVLTDIGIRNNYKVIDNIGAQSPDIALGTNDEVGGAGDQGMCFGYACNETDKMLPKAMCILQELSKRYSDVIWRDNRFLPDGKAQITGYYDDDFRLVKIKDFLISYQNTEVDRDFTDAWIKNTCKDICDDYGVEVENFIINPTGKFLIGGFEGDAGVLGRKIVADSYQSFANVGGGAFSGKDSTKVDRSGAYIARYIAKKLLKENNLRWCEVQISYSIGIARPLAIYVDSNVGNIEVGEEYYEMCKPANIIKKFNLRTPIFYETAQYGHFGNKNFPWEQIDR